MIAINVVWIVLIGGMLASTFSLYSREGVEGREAARIFLKLGPNASSYEVLAEAKLFALKAKILE